MRQRPQDGQFIVFLVELLSMIVRWLNPELSESAVSGLARNFIVDVSRGNTGDLRER